MSTEPKEFEASEAFQNGSEDQKNRWCRRAREYGTTEKTPGMSMEEIRCISEYYRKFKRRIRLSDPLANALQVRFGWAVTVHKALGLSYSEVMFDVLREQMACADTFRWLYTGLCSAEKVWLRYGDKLRISPVQHIKEFARGKGGPGKKMLSFASYKIPEKFAGFVSGIGIRSVMAATCVLAERLETQGFAPAKLYQAGDYLAKAVFSTRQGGECVVAINFTSKEGKPVSSMRVEKADFESREIVRREIVAVMEGSEEAPAESILAPEYEIWKERLGRQGVSLVHIKSHAWQDVFQASKNGESLSFIVHYAKDGFISKIETCSESSESFIHLVETGVLIDERSL